MAKPPIVASSISSVVASIYPRGTKYLVIVPTSTKGSNVTVKFFSSTLMMFRK
eukprot:CAMPEP_0184027050 /NCGR_PEP_ID=MMETSP0954-20121128/13944_1 /TAXON_ID=627963 /ORGANISM="Aplanochytrium sp, Strain PBS07" /LENGTH=52 /DNA_ID=CAMNT_0026311489 /DNA_START=221 /DNA_END=376 /DNA_ORIENTATION=+